MGILAVPYEKDTVGIGILNGFWGAPHFLTKWVFCAKTTTKGI